jgi:DNA-binding transcriptional regulator YiaG
MLPDELCTILHRLSLAQEPIAESLCVSDSTICNWASGEEPVPELAARVLRMAETCLFDGGEFQLKDLLRYASEGT